MKKLLCSLVLTVLTLSSVYAYTVRSNVTLSNDQYGQKLFLYTNGECVVTTNAGRGEGKYDLNYNGQIHIQWANGKKQQGTFTSDNYGLKTVYIEGVTYSVGRRVVPRPR